ncbi:MAG TPA: O-antigen ligase family protein [Cellvibrio sp.]|nr:O-antigen ligase family protein [Cellvibrio sp.]
MPYSGSISLLSDKLEKKLLAWAATGLLIFVSAFLWSPSRDGLQGIYAIAFFIPMFIVLLLRKPGFTEYGNWLTLSALLYSLFSALSSLWGNAADFLFFAAQWIVLAVWLCGSSLVVKTGLINPEKFLKTFITLGVIIILISILYYYGFVYGHTTSEIRLYGWNVFRNANEFGAMCGVIAMLSFISALDDKNSTKQMWIFYFLMILALIGLVLSWSRSAMLAFVGVGMISIFAFRPKLHRLFPLAIICIAAMIVGILTKDLHGFDLRRYLERGEWDSGRFAIWQEVVTRSHDHFLFGIGLARDTNITLHNATVLNHAHNAWLDTFYRTGLLGLALLCIHIYFLVRSFSRSPYTLSLYMWLLYGCVCSLFDGRIFFWEMGAKWFLYWIPAGLIAANHINSTRKKIP